MYKKHLKKQLDIGIDLPDIFYDQVLESEINVIYYGEKMARLLYKRLGNHKLSQIERTHEKIIKKILKKQKPLDRKILFFFKTILKSKNKELYIDFIKSLEYYSIFRYQTVIKYVEEEKTKKALQHILDDEMQHYEENKDLNFKSNFQGFENLSLFLEYEKILKIDYESFKSRMWSTVFYKNIRGIN